MNGSFVIIILLIDILFSSILINDFINYNSLISPPSDKHYKISLLFSSCSIHSSEYVGFLNQDGDNITTTLYLMFVFHVYVILLLVVLLSKKTGEYQNHYRPSCIIVSYNIKLST